MAIAERTSMAELQKAFMEALAADVEQKKKKHKKHLNDEDDDEIAVATVNRYGEAVIVPEDMALSSAIQVLQRQMKQEEEQVQFLETINANPYDGAHALMKVLEAKFGWVNMEKNPATFFSPETPPNMLNLEVGINETVQVPWGRLSIPNVEGWIETTYAWQGEQVVFQIAATVKRKHEKQAREIGQLVREYLKFGSIYRGKAILASFRDADGSQRPIPEISFLDLSNVRESDLVFSKDVQDAIEQSVWVPVRLREKARQVGLSPKRGVLLAGPFGTGKTLAAYVTARHGVENGWTFVMCERADELVLALNFAKQYGPTIVFTEDIDQAISGKRTVSVNDILNTLDGVDAKNHEIIAVFTTNEVEKIEQAAIRPGRFDAVIHVGPPDADAVARLIRLYASGLLRPEETLERIGEALAGQIPAVVAEVVKRSKLTALMQSARTGGYANVDPEQVEITEEALLGAFRSMKLQIELLQPRAEDKRSDFEKLGHAIGIHINAALAPWVAGVSLDAVTPSIEEVAKVEEAATPISPTPPTSWDNLPKITAPPPYAQVSATSGGSGTDGHGQ